MPRRGADLQNHRSGKRSKGMHQMIPQMMPSMMPHGPMMFPHGAMMPHGQMVPMLPPESDSESEAEAPAASASNGAPVAAAAVVPSSNDHAPAHDQATSGQYELSEAMKQKISRSLTYVRQLPRWFLQEVVEYLNANFDSTLVADLSQHGLLALLYLFCRIKPNVRISELRCLIPKGLGEGSGLFVWSHHLTAMNNIC